MSCSGIAEYSECPGCPKTCRRVRANSVSSLIKNKLLDGRENIREIVLVLCECWGFHAYAVAQNRTHELWLDCVCLLIQLITLSFGLVQHAAASITPKYNLPGKYGVCGELVNMGQIGGDLGVQNQCRGEVVRLGHKLQHIVN